MSTMTTRTRIREERAGRAEDGEGTLDRPAGRWAPLGQPPFSLALPFLISCSMVGANRTGAGDFHSHWRTIHCIVSSIGVKENFLRSESRKTSVKFRECKTLPAFRAGSVFLTKIHPGAGPGGPPTVPARARILERTLYPGGASGDAGGPRERPSHRA